MTKKSLPLAVAAAFTAVSLSTSARAQTIASESFWTVNAAPTNGEYRQGAIGNTNVSGTNNTVVVNAGNSGFNTTNAWQGNSSSLTTDAALSLTHSGVVGTTQNGSFRWVGITATTGNRSSSRVLASTPTSSSTYFMSGLIRGTTVTDEGRKGAAGFMGSLTSNTTFNVSTGFHMGLQVESGSLKIAAFGGGTAYNLLNLGSSGSNLTATNQVVLRLDVNASGSETLTAWYAANNATVLTEALAPANIGDFWSSASDLGTFALQDLAAGSGSGNIGYFDEMRFGTTLDSVTTLAVPEPSTWALLVGSFAALVVFRRYRRSGRAHDGSCSHA